MKLKKKLLITSFWCSIFGIGLMFMVLMGFFLYLSPKLPSVESIREHPLQTPLRIYTADGKLIEEFGIERRIPIKFEDIPQDFVHALIAAEDADFYSHNGVSIRGLLRAASQLLLTGRKGSGGSTLTMQVTRHVYLSLKQTFSRKFNEILLALRIEKELSKQEIIELYVNLMYLGNRAYGIEAAAEVYYGTTISDLSLAQHAMLVGVFKGPHSQNPLANPTVAHERRNYVLSRMRKLDYISEQRYNEAIEEPLTASYQSYKIEVNAPYVAEMARKKAFDLYGKGAYRDGYRVYTTVKGALQNRAQDAIVSGLLSYDSRHGYRGAEQTLRLEDAPELETTEQALPLSSEEPISRDYTLWLDALKDIPEYGGLAPAVITHIGENELTALTKDSSSIVIPWDNGIQTARPYINEDRRGPSPKTAEEVARIGDVIRVKQSDDGQWHLKQIPAAQAALVSLAPENGAILALSGGFDFDHSNFNRATQAKRQPGSNFKPFIYTAALENGLTASTIINDAPIVFDDKQLESTWRPVNSNHKFNGPIRLREALYRSVNLVSIRILNRIKTGNAIQSLEKFGFNPDELPKDLSLALGTHAVTPLEVATGYATFANGGYQVTPFLVDKILNVDDEVVYSAFPNTVCHRCDEPIEGQNTAEDMPLESPVFTSEEILAGKQTITGDAIPADTDIDSPYKLESDIFELSLETKRTLNILERRDYPRAPKVISDQVAYIIDSMLKDVVRQPRGTAHKAWKKFRRGDLAGKTGTSNGPLDTWFSGYQPNIVTSTWVGFDQNSPLGRREFGSTAALPIWIDFMEVALADQPVVNRIQPAGIVSARIDPETGKLANAGDPDAIFEIFRDEMVPARADAEAINPWQSEDTINDEIF